MRFRIVSHTATRPSWSSDEASPHTVITAHAWSLTKRTFGLLPLNVPLVSRVVVTPQRVRDFVLEVVVEVLNHLPVRAIHRPLEPLEWLRLIERVQRPTVSTLWHQQAPS